MTVFTCICGFSCGASASFAKHATRMGEGHQLASGVIGADMNQGNCQTVEITVSFHCLCGFTSGTALAFERHCKRTPGNHANTVIGGMEVIVASKTGIQREDPLEDAPLEAPVQKKCSVQKNQLPPLPPSNPRQRYSGATATLRSSAAQNRIPHQRTAGSTQAPPASNPSVTGTAEHLETLTPETRSAHDPLPAAATRRDADVPDTTSALGSSSVGGRVDHATDMAPGGEPAVPMSSVPAPSVQAAHAMVSEACASRQEEAEHAATHLEQRPTDYEPTTPAPPPAFPVDVCAEDEACLAEVMCEGLHVARALEAVSPLPVPALPSYVDAYVPLELLLDTPLASPSGHANEFSSTYNPAFEANFHFPETPEGSPLSGNGGVPLNSMSKLTVVDGQVATSGSGSAGKENALDFGMPLLCTPDRRIFPNLVFKVSPLRPCAAAIERRALQESSNLQPLTPPRGSPKRWSLASTATLELELDAVEGLLSPTAWNWVDE